MEFDQKDKLFENNKLSDAFKKSFLAAKGIKVTEEREEVRTQASTIQENKTVFTEKPPIPETKNEKVENPDVSKKLESLFSDVYLKTKESLEKNYNPDLTKPLNDDTHYFFSCEDNDSDEVFITDDKAQTIEDVVEEKESVDQADSVKEETTVEAKEETVSEIKNEAAEELDSENVTHIEPENSSVIDGLAESISDDAVQTEPIQEETVVEIVDESVLETENKDEEVESISNEVVQTEVEKSENVVDESTLEETPVETEAEVSTFTEPETNISLDDDLLNLDLDSLFDFDAELDEISKITTDVESLESAIKEIEDSIGEEKQNEIVEDTKDDHIVPMDVEPEETIVQPKEKLDFSYHEANGPIKIIDNFAYLKELNPDLYKEIKKAESGLIVDHFSTAENFRAVLDKFVNGVIEKKNMGAKCIQYARRMNSNKKYKTDDFTAVEIAYKIMFLQSNKLLGKETTNSMYKGLHFVREMGNLGAHRENIGQQNFSRFRTEKNINGKQKYLIDGNQLKACFVKLDNAFRVYYNLKEEKFNYNLLKLGDYDIYGYELVSNPEQALYLAQYYGIKQGKKNEYAIIRRYKKSVMDADFIQRNISTLQQINDNTSRFINGVAQVKELNRFDSEDDEDYYVAYIFSKEPKILSQEMLDKIKSNGEKVNVCATLSEAVYRLHTLSTPIYHRMINPNSVVLCDYGENEGYIPYLIGFDFSKLEKQTDFKTVISYYNKEIEKQNQENNLIYDYVCPMDLQSDTSFDARDIYALGKLFTRILTGSLNPQKDDYELLVEIQEKYSDRVAEILERMISEAALERPSAKEVFDVFNAKLQEYER